jgi:hypothetical protein
MLSELLNSQTLLLLYSARSFFSLALFLARTHYTHKHTHASSSQRHNRARSHLRARRHSQARGAGTTSRARRVAQLTQPHADGAVARQSPQLAASTSRTGSLRQCPSAGRRLQEHIASRSELLAVHCGEKVCGHSQPLHAVLLFEVSLHSVSRM